MNSNMVPLFLINTKCGPSRRGMGWRRRRRGARRVRRQSWLSPPSRVFRCIRTGGASNQQSGLKQVPPRTHTAWWLFLLGHSRQSVKLPQRQVYCGPLNLNHILANQRQQYQQYELEMNAHPLYETFLVNTWDLQERVVMRRLVLQLGSPNEDGHSRSA